MISPETHATTCAVVYSGDPPAVLRLVSLVLGDRTAPHVPSQVELLLGTAASSMRASFTPQVACVSREMTLPP